MSFVSTFKQFVSGNCEEARHTIRKEGQYGCSRTVWSGENLSQAFKVHVDCVATSRQPILLWVDGDKDLRNFAELIHRKSHFAKHQFAIVSCRVNPFETWGKALAQLIAPHQSISEARSLHGVAVPPGGTLFFDELEYLPQELQSLLYAQLDQEGTIRFTGKSTKVVEVRIMASSTMDIWRKCEEGLFQASLFCKMNGLSIHCQSQTNSYEQMKA